MAGGRPADPSVHKPQDRPPEGGLTVWSSLLTVASGGSSRGRGDPLPMTPNTSAALSWAKWQVGWQVLGWGAGLGNHRDLDKSPVVLS